MTVDRDSVAMGDDVEPHERVLDVPGETTLGAFLAHLSPDVSVAGPATWVVRLGGRDGAWVGMYDGQMRVLREADRTLADLGVAVVHFDYWAGAPAELLLESLAGGRLPDKTALQREGWRRGWQAEDERAREKQATTTKRLLSPEAVAAVEALGGRVEVHAPSYCRLVAADRTTYVVRSDQHWSRLATVDDAGDQHGLATFRPPGPLAETTLVARLGTAWREARGLAPVEPPGTARRYAGPAASGCGPSPTEAWSTRAATGRTGPSRRRTRRTRGSGCRRSRPCSRPPTTAESARGAVRR